MERQRKVQESTKMVEQEICSFCSNKKGNTLCFQNHAIFQSQRSKVTELTENRLAFLFEMKITAFKTDNSSVISFIESASSEEANALTNMVIC